ncbi:hypothetical protein LWI28_000026 [Acer negundo]|uniref:Diacylglycerol O-acyltransferase n=1 Tax=Acer negundo TaxID=4023 RepID=A0AAD5JPJ9_ACENE|nr:hypothetical protein LWI28_000026 [Acer negundo]
MGDLKPIKVKANVEEVLMEKYEEGGGEPLSPMARMFHEPDSNIYIITMIGFKTQINPQVFKANLPHTLLSTLVSLVMDENSRGLKWVPTTVDLDSHVIVPKLEPNNIHTPDKIVEDYVSNLSKSTIKMSIPMWDLHLLNLKTSYAESTAVFRIHHSLGDGTSLMSLLLASTRKVSDPQTLPTLPMMKKANSSTKSSGGFLGNYFINYDTETPLRGGLGNGATTSRRFVHRMVSLDDVKLVKNVMDITINDVMLGVTQAGLSRYLNRKYGESKIDKGASERNNNLPKNIRLRATFFMNIRPSPGIQELADMMKKNSLARWGNHIGYLLFPFTIALRDDPLDYLREAKATMDRKKASLEASYSYFMAKYFLKFCGLKIATFPSQTTLWFSNVPGPQEEVSYCGHPVAYVAPSCYGQPNGLMIHVVSYVNKMSIILSADESIIPDPHQLCDDLEESLNLIKTAVTVKEG